MRLTTYEAARVLKISPSGVRWLASAGRLACERTPSGLRLFHRADVLRLAGARASVTPPSPPAAFVREVFTRDRRMLRDNLQRLYGLSLPEYDRAVARQGGRCAVCDHIPPTGQRLTVDHDHVTNAIRGLLCGRCNSALGFMRDDAALIHRLAAYADRWALERTRRTPWSRTG